MLDRRSGIAIELLGCTIVAGSWMANWLQAPILGYIDARSWRWMGIAAAVMTGSVGTALTGRWLAVSIAAGLGFVAGATWTEFFQPNDIEPELLRTVASSVVVFGGDIARFVGGATAGGLLARYFRKDF